MIRKIFTLMGLAVAVGLFHQSLPWLLSHEGHPQKYTDEMRKQKVEFKKKYTYAVDSFNVKSHPVYPSPEYGKVSAYFSVGGKEFMLHEIPADQHTLEHRSPTDEFVYVVRGKGHTLIYDEGRAEQKLEWEEGTFYRIPADKLYQIVNTSRVPTRILMWIER